MEINETKKQRNKQICSMNGALSWKPPSPLLHVVRDPQSCINTHSSNRSKSKTYNCWLTLVR